MNDELLCVAGNRSVAESIRERFERSRPELEITAVFSAADALEFCATRSPDCVISSYGLPDSDGITLLESVRASHPDLPFVLFAEDGSEELASQAISAGVTEYVPGEVGQYDRLVERTDTVLEAAAENVYRELFDVIDDAVIVHDPESGDIIDVNDAVCEYWGYSYDQACECTVADLGPSSASTPESSIRELVEQTTVDESTRTEWLCETDDGEEFWADVHLHRATLDGDERVIAIVRDITEQKRKEHELRSFREAVAHAGHSIYITETNGEIVYANQAFAEITGYDVEEAIGRTPRMLKSGAHDKAFYRELWSTVLDGEIWQNEIINERKDGTRYVTNQTIAPITDESGDVVRFVAVNADITEQKRRERTLTALYDAASEWLDASSRSEICRTVGSQLSELLEYDLHGICLYDEPRDRLETTIVSDRANDSFDRLPTFKRGEGIVWKVFESGEVKRYDDVRIDPDVYNPETEIRSEIVVPLGDHGVLLIGSKTPGEFDAFDETVSKILASTVTEVLNRIEREQKLHEQNDRLEEFASVVSHDLRNPLSVANGHLELARETGDEGHFEAVSEAHDRIDGIIEDLLWLAREGQEIRDTHPTDLEEIVEQAWSYVNTPSGTLQTDCDRTVDADPDRLLQVFENLFRNAIEHGGSEITVRVGLLEDGFYVEDDGPGIPGQKRDEVFEAGYTTESDGTGYGLAIVQTIVDAHEWEIDLTESADGGARFEIRFGT